MPFKKSVKSGVRVLAVDDEPLILMTLVDMLEDLGHSVVSEHSGQSALEQLKNGHFDVLLTDQSMPAMTGGQLIEEAILIDPTICVIVATGHSEVPQTLAKNVVKLQKPYSVEDLVAAFKAAKALSLS